MLANTCIESTGRYAMELGYHVTLVRDATAARTMELMHAAHDLNGPSYAHAILKTSELVAALRRGLDRRAPRCIGVDVGAERGAGREGGLGWIGGVSWLAQPGNGLKAGAAWDVPSTWFCQRIMV